MKGTELREKVLIVDDTPENLDILMAALGQKYAVVAAKNGARALKFASDPDKQPDIILLDVMMPEMDGYEVCQRLKDNPATRDIPIIFLTALSDEASELRGLDAGAVDYIHKPISIPLVRARVRNHLNLVRAQRQLASQVEELNRAAKLREDVDRIMRHDLKSPLNPVVGFSELMSTDANITEKQKEWLGFIHQSGLKMLEMINRSLDLFKMERGSYNYQPSLFDLPGLIRRTIKDLQMIGEGKGVGIKLTGEPVSIYGDETLCYSMLSNLVKNALEAAPGGTEVGISVVEEAGQVVTRIHNQGAVPEQIRDAFFEKYTTAGKKGGTGLGTYSARLMAETMLGEISMASGEEQGTTITVKLPGEGMLDFIQEKLLQGV